MATLFLRVARFDPLDLDAERDRHQTESLLKLNRALGLAEVTPSSVRVARGKPNSLDAASNIGKAESGREVADGHRIAIAPVAEHEAGARARFHSPGYDVAIRG